MDELAENSFLRWSRQAALGLLGERGGLYDYDLIYLVCRATGMGTGAVREYLQQMCTEHLLVMRIKPNKKGGHWLRLSDKGRVALQTIRSGSEEGERG